MTTRNTIATYLNPVKSSIMLGWLASHRRRLHTLAFGSKRFFLLVGYDNQKGANPNVSVVSDPDAAAIYQLTYGTPMPKDPDG